MTLATNPAVHPVPNVQKDFYDWEARRREKTALAQQGAYDLLFIGDSITHLFEVEGRGAAIWHRYYGRRRTLNLGYGWDCTQNVLWRLEHGEFAGQRHGPEEYCAIPFIHFIPVNSSDLLSRPRREITLVEY
jgi:hypothetical protein